MRFTSPFAVGAAVDPVTEFFKTWSGHAAGWMPYLIIIAAVLGFVLYTIGHNRGWAHMREALAGGAVQLLVTNKPLDGALIVRQIRARQRTALGPKAPDRAAEPAITAVGSLTQGKEG